ncbi:unnamed protein product [Medioppia subpectinata]|uniref:Transmembrane protein 127 transmembrane region domain-containing protein n=1 Tax=Medioppia subpectinata TaxID=1979941 RepID=A0A7R9KHM3_9ACAR|nr:unnamed protein product [Medioppia subpectinata]CAG2103552.1 unnamed protein product [Medioppia subpectinata]
MAQEVNHHHNNNNNNTTARLYYNRIQSMVTRLPANLRSLDMSWMRLRGDRRRNRRSSASQTIADSTDGSRRPSDETSMDTSHSGGHHHHIHSHRRPPPPPPTRRESSQSLFGSSSTDSTPVNASPALSPTATAGVAVNSGEHSLSRPPHSHLYRHSSHYPLLLGSYNNWSLNRDGGHRFVSHMNSNTNSNNHNVIVDKERNVLSAIMSIVVIATLATALAQPKWFSINGGLCPRKYIGLQEFFYVGNFNNYHFDVNKGKTGSVYNHQRGSVEPLDPKEVERQLNSENIILYGLNGDLKNCVTPEIVTLQRLIIGLCFFAIMFNLIQFFFDTLGVHKKWLNAIRAHALGNILGVLLCVVIVGVSYLVSTLLEKQQHRLLKEQQQHNTAAASGIILSAGSAAASLPTPGGPDTAVNHVEVKFELSYYLVTFSGLLAIIAAASNLLRRPQHYYIDATDAFWTDDLDDELVTSPSATSAATTVSPTHHSWQPFPTSASRSLMTFPSVGQPPPPHPSVSPLPPPPPYTP